MRQAPGQIGGTEMPAFRKGIYTFTMDGINNHTLYYSIISAKYFLMFAVPVIVTNEEGIITRGEIDFMLPDGTPAEHSKYITTLMVLFMDNQAKLFCKLSFQQPIVLAGCME